MTKRHSTRWRAMPGAGGGGGGGAAFTPPPLVDYTDPVTGAIVGRCPGCYQNRYAAERKVLQICRNGSPIYDIGTVIGSPWGSDAWAGGCYIPAYGTIPERAVDVRTRKTMIPSLPEICGGFIAIIIGTNRTNFINAPENWYSLNNKAVKAVLGSFATDAGLEIKTGFGAMGEYGVDTPPGTGGGGAGGNRQYRLPGWASFGTVGDSTPTPDPEPGDTDPADSYDPALVADFNRNRYFYQYYKNVNLSTCPCASLNNYTLQNTTMDYHPQSTYSDVNFTGLIKYDGQNTTHSRSLKTAFLPRNGAYVNQISGHGLGFQNGWTWPPPFNYQGVYKGKSGLYVPFFTAYDYSELGDSVIIQSKITSYSVFDKPLAGWCAWELIAVCPPELVPYLGLEEVTY